MIDLETFPFPSRDFTGIAFFGTSLFLSTGSGLLEFENDQLTGIYKCGTAARDDFEGVSIDRSNQVLLTNNYTRSRFLRFDGENWEQIKLPKANYTREDLGKGFQLISVNDQKWLQNNQRVWTFSTESGGWSLFEQVRTTCKFSNPTRAISMGCFSTLASTDSKLYIFLHGDYVGNEWASGRERRQDESPQSDIVAYLGQNGWVVVNPSGTEGLFSKAVLTGDNEIYAISSDGKVFRIRDDGISQVNQIGNIYASAITSTGRLMVCVADKGIYELRDEWVKLADLPSEFSKEYAFVHIAENAGVIALSISDIKYKLSRAESLPPKVLVSRGAEWKQIY